MRMTEINDSAVKVVWETKLVLFGWVYKLSLSYVYGDGKNNYLDRLFGELELI